MPAESGIYVTDQLCLQAKASKVSVLLAGREFIKFKKFSHQQSSKITIFLISLKYFGGYVHFKFFLIKSIPTLQKNKPDPNPNPVI